MTAQAGAVSKPPLIQPWLTGGEALVYGAGITAVVSAAPALIAAIVTDASILCEPSLTGGEALRQGACRLTSAATLEQVMA